MTNVVVSRLTPQIPEPEMATDKLGFCSWRVLWSGHGKKNYEKTFMSHILCYNVPNDVYIHLFRVAQLPLIPHHSFISIARLRLKQCHLANEARRKET